MSVEDNSIEEIKETVSVRVKKKFFYSFFVFLFLFAVSRSWVEKKSGLASKVPFVSSIFAVLASLFFVALVLALGFVSWLSRLFKAAKKRVFGKTKGYSKIAQNTG
ncbi:MAG: hypothetical protein HY392_02990 [Candidatus Diapherotrites archaeon]|nr:hypothetical protein [Candidatus Diapherotrites archaeon]